MTTAIDTTSASLPVVTEAAANLIRDSISPNTARAYRAALRGLDAYLAGRTLDDAALAAYLGKLDTDGKSPASAKLVLAAARKRAELAGESDSVGPATTAAAAEGFTRNGRSERGRGQAPALDVDAIAEIAGQCDKPLDRAIVLVMFQAALRRSEAAGLEWRDVEPTVDGFRVRVRVSKTNQTGNPDVRFVKNGAARALAAIRPDDAEPTGKVFGLSGQSIGRRFKAAAKRAGFRATAHSARVSLASELTRLGASAQEVMHARD